MADNNLATNCEECQDPQTPCCDHTHYDKCVTVSVDLDCSNIPKGKTLDQVLEQLDAYLCTIRDQIQNAGSFDIQNVGDGKGLFKGVETTNERSFRSLVSETLDITLDNLEKELRIEANYPDVPDVNTTQISNLEELPNTNVQNGINLIHTQTGSEYILKGIVSDSITITEDNNGNIKLDVSIPSAPEQEQSDLLETNEQSPKFIKNSLPTGQAIGDITLDSSHNHKTIEIDNGSQNVQINLNDITETDNYFVGFIQKGTGDVTITTDGNVKVPNGRQATIKGSGHNAAIDIINGTKYILGSLKPVS